VAVLNAILHLQTLAICSGLLRVTEGGCWLDPQILSINAYPGRTFGPDCGNNLEPFVELRPETSRSRVLDTSQLIRKAKRAKQWYAFLTSGGKASVRQPNKEIENPRCGMQHANGVEVHRNRMRHQFSIEVVTEDNDVLGSLEQRHWTSTAVIPDLSLAEEVESGRVDHLRAAQPVVCSEEDGGSKYAFEGRDQPPVLFSAFLHAEGF
jgi:hypothetical protein